MKMSQLLAPTLRDVPAEAEIASHQLLLRAGFMRRVTPGVYNLYPLMWRVVRKVEEIVREEMDRSGALEVRMPILSPAELWQQSGRWQAYGKEMFRLKNRHERDELLGPTHEEVVTAIARDELRSYRQLPMNLYQIQAKFRDEIRPRFGLLRGREFIMKDAYSFHVDANSLEDTYEVMCRTYTRIFERCGLHTRKVESDVGAIGGSAAHEFMVVVETAGGENDLLFCSACDYAANVERAEVRPEAPVSADDQGGFRQVPTPAVHTIEQLVSFFQVPANRIVKTLLYRAQLPGSDGGEAEVRWVAVCIRGDVDVNEVKLQNRLAALELRLASAEEVLERSGAPVGFVGPRGLKVDRFFVDATARDCSDFIVGINVADAHGVGARWGRDLEPGEIVDVRLARAGDACPRCAEGHLSAAKGIEVGNTFKLGTKYSAAMQATFMDADGLEKPFVMGCYGIGVTRTAQAAVEAFHDADGIRWPLAIAPYHLVIVPVNLKDAATVEWADRLYGEAGRLGIEAVLDDREERAGVKFKDADLIGFPFRVTLGKTLSEGLVELKHRTGEVEKVPAEQVLARIREAIVEMKARRDDRTPVGV